MATSSSRELHEPLLTRTEASDADGNETEHIDGKRPQAQGRTKPMAAVERLVLSPYEKWLAHGRFPYKIVLHVLLLVLTSAQMGIYGVQNAAYMRATHRNWAYFFLPPAQDIGIVPRYQRELFTLNETLAGLAFIRDAYFSIGNTSVANYEYVYETSGAIAPLEMSVMRRLATGDVATQVYNVTNDPGAPIGPFDPTLTPWQQKHVLRSLLAVHFAFVLEDVQYGDYYRECFRWRVHVSLTSVESAQLKAEIGESHIARCSHRSFWHALQQRFVWLHVVIAVMTLVYMALSVKALRRSVSMITRAQTMLESHRIAERAGGDATSAGADATRRLQREAFGSWAAIPFALKLKLFNGLQLVILTALVLLLASSMWSLFFLKAHVPIHFWHRLLHATAMLLLWSCLVGYLEHNSHVYSIVLTLKWGAPRVLQFLVGVSPIFFGYALFGTIYFGARIKEFGSLSASMATLFAVMNGDVILDTFDALELHHFAISGKLYLYSFIALFIYVVLNIFVAIVEEAFFATRSCRRMLSALLSDPDFATARVSQETEVSAEMVRVLLRAAEAADATEDDSIGGSGGTTSHRH